jgi:hypothetical protein
MVELDIQKFSEGRTKARAYLCYLFSKNIPNRLPSITQDMIIPRLLKIKADLENFVSRRNSCLVSLNSLRECALIVSNCFFISSVFIISLT